MRKVWLVFLLPLLLVCGSSAVDQSSDKKKLDKPDDKAKKVEDTPSVKRGLWEAVMDDHSLVKVELLQEQIQVATPYGLLKVPASDVRRIEFMSRPVPDAPKKIAAAIEKLKSDEFAVREAGNKELVELGPASYHAVVEATHAEDLEVKQRATAVLKKLEQKFPTEELRRKPHDVIETPTFTIAGHIQGSSLKVKTVYFGEVQLKLPDIRTFSSLGSTRGATLALDASKYAAPGGTAWLETGVAVRSGTRLLITATGEIDMYPLGGYNGQYRATPSGPKWGGTYVAPSPGMIVGRVGSSGKEFTIGEKYEGTPGEVGMLHLRIITSPWSNASSGEYKVTIRGK